MAMFRLSGYGMIFFGDVTWVHPHGSRFAHIVNSVLLMLPDKVTMQRYLVHHWPRTCNLTLFSVAKTIDVC